MNLKKKVGPLPLWAWIVVVGGGIGAYLIIRHNSSSSSSSSATTAESQVDPNNPLGLTYAQENADIAAGIDPNTGQTYASEQGGLPDTSGGGGGSGDTGGGDTGSGYLTDASITQDFENALVAEGLTVNGSSSSGSGSTTSAATTLKIPKSVTSAITKAEKTASEAFNAPGLAAGARRAPFGSAKPKAPTGFHTVGQGNGYWEFVPNTVRTKSRSPGNKGAANDKGRQKTVSGGKAR